MTEKEVELIKEQQLPKSKLIKTILQVIRVIGYISLSYILAFQGEVVLVDGKVSRIISSFFFPLHI